MCLYIYIYIHSSPPSPWVAQSKALGGCLTLRTAPNPCAHVPEALHSRYRKRTSQRPASLRLGFAAIIKCNKDYGNTALRYRTVHLTAEGHQLTSTQAVNPVWTCCTKGWSRPRQDGAGRHRVSPCYSNPCVNYNLRIVYLWNFQCNILRP